MENPSTLGSSVHQSLWDCKCVFHHGHVKVGSACQCSRTRMLQESKHVPSPFPLAMLIRLCALQVHKGGTGDVYASCLLLPIGITKETRSVNGRWCYLLKDDAVFQICCLLEREGNGFATFFNAVLIPTAVQLWLHLMPLPSCCLLCPGLVLGVAWEGQGYCIWTCTATEKEQRPHSALSPEVKAQRNHNYLSVDS